MIFVRQSLAQELERRQVHCARSNEPQYQRKTVAQPRSRDSSEGLTFAEAQSLHAEVEHGREAGFEVQPALLDLSQIRHDFGHRLTLVADELDNMAEQITVRNIGEQHTSV